MYSQQFIDCLVAILKEIYLRETELELLRILLNEQIQFNLQDLYQFICPRHKKINTSRLQSFLVTSLQISALERLIRFYNAGGLELSFVEFTLMFLSRENKMLTQLVIDRPSLGTLPNYILNYARKIINKEINLHQSLLTFQIEWQNKLQQFLQQREIQQIFKLYSSQRNENQLLSSEEQWRIISRYMERGTQQSLSKESFIRLFSPKTEKKQKKEQIIISCVTYPKTNNMLSRREVQSIEKHLNRINNNCKKKSLKRVNQYRKVVSQQLFRVCQYIREILWLQKEIQYVRKELNLCSDFDPALFYECFDKDGQDKIIPSAMQQYLRAFGLQIPLPQIFLLFKRYAQNGKMGFSRFCLMFIPHNSNAIERKPKRTLSSVCVQTKKTFLVTIVTILKIEKQMQQKKKQLILNVNVDLREVFSCLDVDENGLISQKDLQAAWKQCLDLEIREDELSLLWFLFGHTDSQSISYEQFIREFTPKSSFKIK